MKVNDKGMDVWMFQGTERKQFRRFEEAREYTRLLGLTSQKEWEEWCKLGKRPQDIPFNPHRLYRDKGWRSWQDWLGYKKMFLPFEDAREYARSLGLTCQKDWQELSRSGLRPEDIPSNPQRTYRNKGWVSWPDWLGYGRGKKAKSRTSSKQFLPFSEAREFARSLGLASTRKWREWCTLGQRPHNIPSDPQITYRDDGWVSWPDWLGYTEDRLYGDGFMSFEKSREYVRSLGMTSHKEWQEWSASGERPENIPSNPQTTYYDEGWLSWPDWLGYGEGRLPRSMPSTKEDHQGEETEYREYDLAATKDWQESREWCALYNFIVPLYYTSGTLIYLFYYRTTVISLFYYIIK